MEVIMSFRIKIKNITLATILCLSTILLSAAPQLSQFKFNAASVLFETTKKENGQSVRYVLLAREAFGKDKGTWDDFGGKRDPNEHRPSETASREAQEEMNAGNTLGWSVNNMKKYISLSQNTNTSMVLALQKIKYVTYVTNIPYAHVCTLGQNFFSARTKTKSFHHLEKDGLALVRYDDLMHTVKNGNPTVKAYILDKKTNCFTLSSTIKLRPVLHKKLEGLACGHTYTQGTNNKIRFY